MNPPQRLTEALVAKFASIRTGDPLDASTQMGPLISAAQREKVCDYYGIAM